MKNRPFIPPPVMTPPSVVVPRESETAAAAHEIQAALASGAQQAAAMGPPANGLTLSVVQPPARVARAELLSDRINLYNPTIELIEYIMPTAGDPKQTKRLTPAFAVVIHGTIVIEELHLAIPLGGYALIRI